MNEDIYMMAGVPSWTLVLLKRILELKGTNNIHEVWPNLELFWHGGVSFKPYKEQFTALDSLRSSMNYVETYNASEGFLEFRIRLDSDDLVIDVGLRHLLRIYADVGVRKIKSENNVSLKDVELGENYAYGHLYQWWFVALLDRRHYTFYVAISIPNSSEWTHETLHQCIWRRTHGG
jgi:hypothetical protein